jgi:hypothetical protein
MYIKKGYIALCKDVHNKMELLPKDAVRVDFIDKFLVSIKYHSDLCYDSNGYQSHSQYASVSHGSSYYRTMTYYADHPCHAGICNSWQGATPHVTRTNEALPKPFFCYRVLVTNCAIFVSRYHQPVFIYMLLSLSSQTSRIRDDCKFRQFRLLELMFLYKNVLHHL